MKSKLSMLILWVSGIVSSLIGEPIIYQATGYSPSDIESVVEQFRQDIGKGGVNNQDLLGPLENGWREITWDDMSGGQFFFHDFVNQGVIFSPGPAECVLVSDLPFGPSDPNRNFGDINTSYAAAFQPFSSPSLALLDSPIPQGSELSLLFHPSGEAYRFAQTTIRAFGVVFSDVDLPETTILTLDMGPALDDEVLYYVPPSPGDGGLSFLGVIADPAEVIVGASLRLGNSSPSSSAADGATSDLFLGQINDVVAFDNVIFSEPRLVPEPSTIGLVPVGIAMFFLWAYLARNFFSDRDCSQATLSWTDPIEAAPVSPIITAGINTCNRESHRC